MNFPEQEIEVYALKKTAGKTANQWEIEFRVHPDAGIDFGEVEFCAYRWLRVRWNPISDEYVCAFVRVRPTNGSIKEGFSAQTNYQEDFKIELDRRYGGRYLTKEVCIEFERPSRAAKEYAGEYRVSYHFGRYAGDTDNDNERLFMGERVTDADNASWSFPARAKAVPNSRRSTQQK